MRENTGEKIKLGLFVSIGTFLLLIAVILIGRKQNVFNKNIIINTVFTDVNGLRLGNNIYYSGIKIGTVKNIEIIEYAKILVQMNIDSDNAKYITKKDIATISLSGLVGDMVVNILPTKQESQVIKEGDTIASFAKTSTENMLSTLNTINEKVGVITDNILHITNQIIRGKGALSQLINDETVAIDLKKTMQQLNQTTHLTNTTFLDLKKN
ncbi:MlaD family protein [Aquimarina agarivorans]|uniref:MlaD family protein n=1 Tax=Aquimarina agarivorans TaxID=980584 RepID=UPI0002E6AC7D|nr:MlaD family protein [Aquimarina agarivorans]